MEPDRLLGVELRHLAALQAVAEQGSFGRAAQRLGYTQSAISQQIQALERMVGERLIDRPRGPRAVSLTEAGRLLLGHAEAIVARLKAAQADLAALAEGQAGSLRIGTYQSVGARVLPTVMREFKAAWPRVEIQLTEVTQDGELLDLVERGALDLTFTILPLPEGPFQGLEVLRDPYVLVVQPDSPLARRESPPTLQEIAELPLISFNNCSGAKFAEAQFRARGVEPNIVFRSNDNGTMQGLVVAGMGAALMPRLAVGPSYEGIAVLELASKLPPRLIAIAWHRDRYQSPAARAFVECAREVCADVEASWPAPVRGRVLTSGSRLAKTA